MASVANTSQKIESPWLSLKQAGQYAHRHPQTLAREINAGRLRAARIGGKREFFLIAAWIDEWMADQAPTIIQPVRRRSF